MLLICALKLGKDVGGEGEERNKDEGEPCLVDSKHLHDVRLSLPGAKADTGVVWLAWLLKEECHLLQLRWSHYWLAPQNSGTAYA